MQDGKVTVHDDPSEGKEAYDHAKDSFASKDMSSIKPGFDHFNNEETDPKKTNAMSMCYLTVTRCVFYFYICTMFHS